MPYIEIILLMSLLEVMFVYFLWRSLKTGTYLPTGSNVFSKKWHPIGYWLYIAITVAIIVLGIPLMAITLLSPS